MGAEATAFRANWTRVVLAGVEARLPADVKARVLARVGARQLELIEQAGPLEWLGAEVVHVPVVDAIFEALGPNASRAFWRDLLADNLQGRLFRAVFEGTKRAFGTQPHDLARALPISWEIVARAAGRFRITPEPELKILSVSWTDLPAVLLRNDAFIVSMQGILEAVVTAGGARGVVTTDLEERGQKKVGYRFRWG